MKFLSKICFLFISLAIISGCTPKLQQRVKKADKLAISRDFTPRIIKGGEFWLATYQKVTNPSKPYVIYVEGDGMVMRNRYTISENPTPISNMLLELATMDTRPNVIYMARPCQFTPAELNPLCQNNTYWTNKRLSREVIASMREAISTIAADNPIDLVGFSGGGGVVSLIASHRKNLKINSIITIAGLLDHVAFNREHGTKPMIGSLNPIDYTDRIKQIPQLHLSGGRDTVVPAFIANNYVQKSNSICVKQEIVPEASHNKKWDHAWESLLDNLPIKCY